MDINKIFQSKSFQAIIIILGILIIVLLIFKAGMIVGGKKADFSCHWNDNYQRNFAGPKEGFLKGFRDRDFMEANGIFGQILKVEGNSIVIKGRNDIEKVISTDDKTVIKSFDQTIKISDLKIDEVIVVIGDPNSQGQIEARLIRLMPQPPKNNLNGQPLAPIDSPDKAAPFDNTLNINAK
ncbi:MAG: hypothetical protein NTZ49_04150 [Candidatus Parcubacteria bacterium]|nr:hypothetical protein [Candidatus Parcubacteria bacterium]